MSKRRREMDEDVLLLRDLDRVRLRLMILGLVAAAVLVYVLAALSQTVSTSLDQLEETTERLNRRDAPAPRDAPQAPAAAAASSSEPAKT